MLIIYIEVRIQQMYGLLSNIHRMIHSRLI